MIRFRMVLAMGVGMLAVPFLKSSGQQVAAPVDSTKLYHELLAKFSTGDTAVSDVTAMRFAYAASSDYQPMPDVPDDWRDQVLGALVSGDVKKAMKVADRMIALDPLNLDAYVLRSSVRTKAGDPGGSKQDAARAQALYASIVSIGDGSQEQPWVVISIAEEYYVLMAKSLRRTDQALSSCAGRPCDVLTLDGKDKAGRSALYFDVSIPLAFEQKMLGKP